MNAFERYSMEQKKVTIIIPIYNAEKYLRECLDSVVSQTLTDIEIFCINDGSVDLSQEILCEYSQNDSRIHVEKIDNHGPAYARNLGIRKGNGKYVAFIDADDYYPSNDVLETLYQKAEENNTMITGGEFSMLTPNGKIIGPECFKDDPQLFGYYFEKEGFIKYRDYQFDYGYHRFLYNKQFLTDNKILFPDLRRYQDPPFFVFAMSNGEYFYAVKKVTYCYRIKHKAVDWDNTKIADLLSGLIWNLEFAERNGYTKLKAITMERMCEEYRGLLVLVQEKLRDSIKVSNSISYKIGLLLTYFPRKLVHIFERL